MGARARKSHTAYPSFSFSSSRFFLRADRFPLSCSVLMRCFGSRLIRRLPREGSHEENLRPKTWWLSSIRSREARDVVFFSAQNKCRGREAPQYIFWYAINYLSHWQFRIIRNAFKSWNKIYVQFFPGYKTNSKILVNLNIQMQAIIYFRQRIWNVCVNVCLNVCVLCRYTRGRHLLRYLDEKMRSYEKNIVR